MSNLCYFIKLLLLFPACLIYSPIVVLSNFVVSSNFCHFLIPCYLFTIYVMYASYKYTCSTHRKHNSLSSVLSCARSLRQYTFLNHQASLAIMPFSLRTSEILRMFTASRGFSVPTRWEGLLKSRRRTFRLQGC